MPSLERQSDSGGRSVDAACGCPAFNFLIGGEPYARGFDIRRSSRASASGRITMPCRVHCQPACPTRPSRLVREHDANTTVTNGCPRAQTRRTSSSGEMAIYLHQRIRPPIRAHVTLSAHNPKVAGSNPAPATKQRSTSEALSARRGGPLTLSEAVDANRTRTGLTLGLEPEGRCCSATNAPRGSPRRRCATNRRRDHVSLRSHGRTVLES
jgi:hypothetical protein